MDFNRLIARVKAILANPKTEWSVIAAEPATVKSLYLGYIMILAAIPAVFGFIENSLIGHSMLGVHIRFGIGMGIGSMVLGWVLALVGVYVVALIVNALANTFGGQPDQTQALKTVAYAYTASWVAGIGNIIPWIGWLIILAGAIYTIYLLYLGLPHTMKCPPERATGYTVVTIIAAIVVFIVIGIIVAGVTGVGFGHNPSLSQAGGSGATVTFDKGSTLGKLDAFSKRMEAANKAAEAAGKSGDGAQAGAAFGAAMGALAGSKAPVEALATDQLKAFAPQTLNGMPRTSLAASRNAALGMQTAEVKADYGDQTGRHLRLTITDLGGASGVMGLAHLAGESEKQTDTGYEKTYQQDGSMVHEEWDSRSKRGTFSTTIADRFTVELTGRADSMDDLKHAVASVDLQGLAALKDHGITR
ncbi:MAG TPA: Yip1 family protein [Rhodanobacteraceae bacterium]|nr:Yip1 family protein [Rhodanobacteraceae bacterium]